MLDETQELLNKTAIELADVRNELAVVYKNLDTACKISDSRLDTIVELNNRINKAIKYIENDKHWFMQGKTSEDLIDILKGEK
jgi:hypothetical protein